MATATASPRTQGALLKDIKAKQAELARLIDQLEAPPAGSRPRRQPPAAKAKAKAKAKAAKPRAAAAAAGALPFPEYADVAAGRPKDAREILIRRTTPELQAALRHEKAGQGRGRIERIIQAELNRRAPAGARPAAKPKAAKPKAAKGKAGSRVGRPSLAERPREFAGTPPVAGYGTWSFGAGDPGRDMRVQIAAISSAAQARALRDFEAAQAKPRATVIKLLDRRAAQLQSARPQARQKAAPKAKPKPAAKAKADAALPFPEYADVAAGRPKDAREILIRRTTPELQAALRHEKGHQARPRILKMIQAQLNRRAQEAQPPAAATAKAAKPKPAAKAKADAALPFPEYADVAAGRPKDARKILIRRTTPELHAALRHEKASQNRGRIVRLIQAQLNRREPGRSGRAKAALDAAAPEGKPGRPQGTGADAALPFPEYADVAAGRPKDARLILKDRSVPDLRAALEYEAGHQARPRILKMIQAQINRKAGPKAAPRPAPEPKPAAEAAPEPIPGYRYLQSSRIPEARALLIGHSVADLNACLEHERAHQGRAKMTALIERIIEQKEAGSRPASRRSGEAPVQGYDSLPTPLILKMVTSGSADTRLADLLAWEQAHAARPAIIAAISDRREAITSGSSGPPVSPSGRIWKGREPFPGYGSLSHDDRVPMLAALRARPSADLRRVEAAEAKQDFPSRTAIDAAREVISDRAAVSQAAA